MATDISDLINNAKVENEGKTPQGRVSAEEFNRLIQAVGENQNSVKTISVDTDTFSPDENGNVVLRINKSNDTYSVRLILEESPAETQMSDDVTIKVKGTSSVEYAAGGSENINEVLTLEIQTRTSQDGAWNNHIHTLAANNPSFVEISLKNYLYSGTNYVRMRVVGEYSSSVWQSYTLNVVNLSLVPNNTFEVPFESVLSLNYLIGGTINKTLQFEFGTGLGSDFVAEYSYLDNDPGCSRSLGTDTNTSTGVTFDFTDTDMLATLLSVGVHTIRARLYVSEDVYTDWVESQYMVAGSAPLVAVNDVQSNLANWTDVRFFDWSVFTPNEPLAVVFRLTDETNTTEYASWTFNALNSTKYQFSTQLGIELSDPTVTEFYGYMHIEDNNGNELAPAVFFQFSNNAEFVPTSGADFILQPANRNNGESNPARIINAANGNEVAATFSGFGFVTDGWMNVNKDVNSTDVNAEKVRALHIPSGRSIDIDYNPFSDLTSGNNTGRNMTMEWDFRTSNILDDEDPVLRIGVDDTDGKIWGFEMLPTKAYMLTQRMRAVADQDTDWAEDIRTHLAVNVVYGLAGLNYVRIFVNGRIEREFNYESNDRFTQSGVHIKLGNNTSDLDIFGMRVYKKALSTDAVMSDYKASLSTAAEKLAFQTANDITISNEIAYSKCLGKYNIICHTGHLPKYGDENKGKTNGVSLYINIPGDPDHSGTLTNLEASGQGTTAMTYYDWNQQYKIGSSTAFICDNGTTYAVGRGYAIKAGEALAKKLCGKINFASSMQSHKLGLTWIYTDLFKRLVDKGQMSMPGQFDTYPAARLSVLEKPFFFFHRETENDPWTFKYLMTFGAAKGDKPTFGYNDSATPNMLMVEGANNDRPLALFRIPWNEDVAYDPDEEAWMYNGQKQLNFGLGLVEKVNGKDTPCSTDAINAMRAFFNFAYLHHSRVRYFNGTLSELKRSSEVSTNGLYWVTQSEGTSERYDLYRYDELTATWVDAGIAKQGVGSYAKLNLRSQYEAFCTEIGSTAQTWTQGQWDNINASILATRRAHFKATASDYFHTDDALYHSCFIKFYAGTDNRAKNTYYYTDPVTLKIRWMQDDLDTTIKTNNVGQNRKPYYVEEHDKNAAGDYYWQGEESGFYNVLEEAFESEMTIMMRNMLTAMAELGGSAMGFLEQYFLSTQDYFPAIAYNEQARLVYEVAAVAQAAGIYKNDSVQAITQSCGSQRWSEYQWLKDRLMYISSWCEYGEFAGSSTAANGMSWRGKSGATYNFQLTPAKWLYPRVGSDSGNYPASANGRVRVPAGTTLNYPSITLSSDSWIAIRGIDYMLDIGDMNIGLSSEQGTFSFSGRRLQAINVNPNGTDENLFLATGITISNATNIKELTIRGVTSVGGAFDLTKCTRLNSIDLRSSKFSVVDMPASGGLTSVYLPASITEVRVTEQPNLASLTIESNLTYTARENGADVTKTIIGGSLLKDIEVKNNSILNTYSSLVAFAYNAGAELESVYIENVDWSLTNTTIMEYLADLDNCTLKGVVDIAGSNQVSFAIKRKFLETWGAIDNPNNDLYMTYVKRNLSGFEINGETYLGEAKDYKMDIVPNEFYGNRYSDIQWSIESNIYATIDENTGVVSVNQLGTEAAAPTAVITCTITAQDNNGDDVVLTKQKTLGFYLRSAHVGDYVFYDGTFSDIYDPTKTVVGVCFYIDPQNPSIRLMAATGAVGGTDHWGLYNNASNGVSGVVVTADPSYQVYDTPIVNISGSNVTISDSNYRKPDGSDFAPQAAGTHLGDIGTITLEEDLMGHRAGEVLAIGQYKTLLLMKHRNYILENTYEDANDPSTARPTPSAKYLNGQRIKTELADLQDLIRDIVADHSNAYREFYYPAASYCFAYEPAVTANEVLNPKFAENNWWLPSSGELARIYWYHKQGYTVGTENAIFANAYSKNVFNSFGTATYWSVTEGSATYAWHLLFSSGNLYGSLKYYTHSVRAVCAF